MSRRSERRRRKRQIARPDRLRSSTHHQPQPKPIAQSGAGVLWLTVAIAGFAILLTIDDRYPGAIADGRQMAWTAVAISETGEIGQARGRDFTWPRGQGDAVSRYGMGMSLAQLPAAWLAPRLEAELGPGTSQPLFLIVPFLCVCASAAAGGWVALSLGLGTAGVVTAVLLTAIGSPLGSYAALDLSEPLQAAALSLAFAGALASTHPHVARRRALLYAALAGVAAGIAVLTKSSLWVAVPFALLPMVSPGGRAPLRARISVMFVGFAGPVGAWIWFEITRFGRLFASYAGEGFTHSFLDGFWRLLAGPNRGLLLYFPALAVAIAAGIVSFRGPSTRTRLAVMASLGILVALLALAAKWWAWHGLWGWGPRLLVPAIPPLAASAAIIIDRWPRLARHGLLLVSVIVNMPGLLQNAAPVTVFTAACEWPTADPLFARSLADYARREAPDGTYRVAPDHVLETVPRASPFLVYPWFAAATWTHDVEDAPHRLKAPPWIGARPGISCGQGLSADFVGRLMKRSGWPVWGRAFWPDPNAPGFPGVYDEGLLDQVVRAQQLGRGEQALALARKLARVAPEGEADAQILESLRLLRRRAEAAEHLSSLSPERRSQPKINVVLALFERDAGNEQLARNLLGSVVSSFPGTPAQEALLAPLGSWPRDLHSMTTTATDQAGRPTTFDLR
jgi:hypothetical protein